MRTLLLLACTLLVTSTAAAGSPIEAAVAPPAYATGDFVESTADVWHPIPDFRCPWILWDDPTEVEVNTRCSDHWMMLVANDVICGGADPIENEVFTGDGVVKCRY